MDLEMKFLSTFYAALTIVTSLALLAVLATDPKLASMIVVVVGMFAMMAFLAITTLRSGS